MRLVNRWLVASPLLLAGLALAAPSFVSGQDTQRSEPASLRPITGMGPRLQLERLPDAALRRLEALEKRKEAAGIGSRASRTDTRKGVFNMVAIWPAQVTTLKVCFEGGSRTLRANVAEVAQEWNKAVPGLPKLNFGRASDPQLCRKSGENSHIRIGFDPNEDTYSLSGTQSVEDLSTRSMNFSDVEGRAKTDLWFRTQVLHEFGHAFGLEHEHQHPDGACSDEINWPKVFELTKKPPYNWSEGETRAQMARLKREGLLTTKFDPDSIMLYELPKEFLKPTATTCRVTWKGRISEGDKAVLVKAYSDKSEERIALATQIRSHHRAMIERNDKVPGTKKDFGLLDTLLDPDLPPDDK